MNQGTNTSSHILSGWKDIANYLGKGVRTVQRYEGDLRLPVRRPAGRARGSVVATTAEIDSWVAASPIREQLKTGISDSRPFASVEIMKHGIEEMVRLRSQMRELRVDLRVSMHRLDQSVRAIHAEMHPSEFGFSEYKVIAETGNSNSPAVSLMGGGESTLRKAS
jgi:hypothetical protein